MAAAGQIEWMRVSAPGRACLFGEHQDYLGLPVIPCAISLRITIEGRARSDREVYIQLPDIGSVERFPLNSALEYFRERDYFRSAVNVLYKHGYSFTHGADCMVRGEIPINAGAASSSALVVCWVAFLAGMSDRRTVPPPLECARLAHEAEVLEFREPGGMMDHYTAAMGGVLDMHFSPEFTAEKIRTPLATFVLGESGEPKDTMRILAQVKHRVLDIVGRLKLVDPSVSLISLDTETLASYRREITGDEYRLLEGTVRNHAITREARKVLRENNPEHRQIGRLMTAHQSILRDVLGISTPKIDRMIEAALNAGAYGAKINGSGGGGTMIAYAPEDATGVASAIRSVGGRALIVSVDRGMHVETEERKN